MRVWRVGSEVIVGKDGDEPHKSVRILYGNFKTGKENFKVRLKYNYSIENVYAARKGAKHFFTVPLSEN